MSVPYASTVPSMKPGGNGSKGLWSCVSECLFVHDYLIWNLTWPWKIIIFNRRYVFKWLFFHCHVSLQGCKCGGLISTSVEESYFDDLWIELDWFFVACSEELEGLWIRKLWIFPRSLWAEIPIEYLGHVKNWYQIIWGMAEEQRRTHPPTVI